MAKIGAGDSGGGSDSSDGGDAELTNDEFFSYREETNTDANSGGSSGGGGGGSSSSSSSSSGSSSGGSSSTSSRTTSARRGIVDAVEQDTGSDTNVSTHDSTSSGRSGGSGSSGSSGGSGSTTSGGNSGGSTGGNSGLTDAQQQNIDATMAEDVDAVRNRQQGIEGADKRAGGLEQQVLEQNPELSADDVRVDREGDRFVARLNQSGMETLGANPTDREIRQSVASGNRFDADQYSVHRTSDGVEVGLSDREYGAYTEKVGNLARGDPSRSAAIVDDAPMGAQLAATQTPEAAALGVDDLSTRQQQRVNERVVTELTNQQSAGHRRVEHQRAEDFGDSSGVVGDVEGALRDVSGGIRDVGTDVAGAGANAVLLTGPSPAVVGADGQSGVVGFGDDNPGVKAQRGAVRAPFDVAAMPADMGVTGIETSELVGYSHKEVEAGRGDQLSEDLGDAGETRTRRMAAHLASDPVEEGVRLGATAAFSAGAIKGAQVVGGARTAQATSFAMQPFEDIARAGVRRGMISKRLGTKIPGVRSGQFSKFVGDESAQLKFSGKQKGGSEETTITAEDLDVSRRSTDPPAYGLEFNDDLGDISAFDRRRNQRTRQAEPDSTTTNELGDTRPSPESHDPVERMQKRMESAHEPEVTPWEVDLPGRSELSSAARIETATQEAGLVAKAEARSVAENLNLELGRQAREPSLRGRQATGLEMGLETMQWEALEPGVRQEIATDVRTEQEFGQELGGREWTSPEWTSETRTGRENKLEREPETNLPTEFGYETDGKKQQKKNQRPERDGLQIGAGATGGSDDMLGFGWGAETYQNIQTGGLESAHNPDQHVLAEMQAENPAAGLPTAEVVSGDVNLGEVHDFFDADGVRF